MQIEHKKNTAYYLAFPMVDSSTPASFKTGVSPADTAYYKDGAGAWTSLAITDTASEIGSTGVYEIDLTASEMNHDQILIKFSVAGAADSAFLFDTRTKLVSDLNDVSTAQVNTECDTAISDAALATAAALATVDANVDAVLADTGTDGVVISAATANQIADALLTRDWTSVSGEAARSALNALRFLRNKYSVSGTTLTVTEEDDTTTAWTSTLTTDATADPVTGSDPV